MSSKVTTIQPLKRKLHDSILTSADFTSDQPDEKKFKVTWPNRACQNINIKLLVDQNGERLNEDDDTSDSGKDIFPPYINPSPCHYSSNVQGSQEMGRWKAQIYVLELSFYFEVYFPRICRG